MKLSKKIIIAATLFFTVFMIAALLWVMHELTIYKSRPAGPADITGNIKKTVIIHNSQRFSSTCKMLHQEGIILKPEIFKFYARFKEYDKKIKAGEYLLSPAMTPEKILSILVGGQVHLYKLTIPEGYNIWQTASAVEKAGLCTKENFIKSATDVSMVHSMGIDAETFEGYLFPDTYYFPKDVSPEKIISAMVGHFNTLFTSPLRKRAKKTGLTLHQTVTLASIIEKETGAESERAVISSVFHNRLKKRMRLESDPTVIYGIKNFNGNITRKDLAKVTPYNTYKIKGLPPGPIANPGLEAIKAVLYPADTRFLYFVSKKNGLHHFSTNIKEHNRAVRKYQMRRKR